MPAGDRTGPEGLGPQTGRGLGDCGDVNAPGYRATGFGWRGFGMRRGGGWRGHRGWWQRRYRAAGLHRWLGFGNAPSTPPYTEPVTPQQEIDDLKSQASWLKEQLDAINQRIAGLGQEKPEP